MALTGARPSPRLGGGSLDAMCRSPPARTRETAEAYAKQFTPRHEAEWLMVGDESVNPIQFRHAGTTCLEHCDDGNLAVSWVMTPELV